MYIFFSVLTPTIPINILCGFSRAGNETCTAIKMQSKNAETNAYVKETKSTVKTYLNVTGYSAKHCVALYNILVRFCLLMARRFTVV
jgi:hypothetical protein